MWCALNLCGSIVWLVSSLLYFCLSRCVICSEARLRNVLQLGAMAITANRGFSLPISSVLFWLEMLHLLLQISG